MILSKLSAKVFLKVNFSFKTAVFCDLKIKQKKIITILILFGYYFDKHDMTYIDKNIGTPDH